MICLFFITFWPVERVLHHLRHGDLLSSRSLRHFEIRNSTSIVDDFPPKEHLRSALSILVIVTAMCALSCIVLTQRSADRLLPIYRHVEVLWPTYRKRDGDPLFAPVRNVDEDDRVARRSSVRGRFGGRERHSRTPPRQNECSSYSSSRRARRQNVVARGAHRERDLIHSIRPHRPSRRRASLTRTSLYYLSNTCR